MKKKHKLISLFLRKDIFEIFPYKLSFLILTLSFDLFFCCLYTFNFHLRKLYHMKKHIHFGYEFVIGFKLFLIFIGFFLNKTFNADLFAIK